MSAHALLLWMSARRAGSWQQFRSAVEALHIPVEEEEASAGDSEGGGLPYYQQLRLGFERLAHAEFFTQGCEDGWRVAAPVLAVRESNQEWKGIVCGARSPRLLSAFQVAADSNGVDYCTEDSTGQPPIIRVVGPEERLARFAETTGISMQKNASLAILSCIPAIDDTQYLRASVLPMGEDWKIDRFDPQTLGWRAISRDEAVTSRNRFLRFVFGYERHYFLTLGGRVLRLRGPGGGQIGKYLVLRRCRHNVLRYLPASTELIIPASCRPPLLVERALVLTTGSLPTFEQEESLLRYRDIPGIIARFVAELLCQEI